MDQTTLTVGRMIDAVLHRWKWVVLIVAVVPLLVVAVTRLHRPPYEASARLVIQENADPFLGDLTVQLELQNRFPVVRNVLQSRTVAEGILRDLGEIDESSSPEEVNSRIRRFQDALDIDNTGGGVVSLKVRGDTPEQAYNRLDLVMDALLEEILRPQRESLDTSVEFLSGQLRRMSAELSDAEDRIRMFKEEHAEELPEVFEGNLERYLDTLADLQQAEADLAVAERQLSMSEEDLAAYSVDPLLAELERDLVRAEDRLETLLDTYTRDHPQVIRAQRRVESLEDEIEERRENPPDLSIEELDRVAETSVDIEVVAGERPRLVAENLMTGEILTHRAVRREVETLRYRIARIEAQRDDLRDAIRSYAGNEQVLNELVRDVEAKSALYNDLARRYQDAVLTRELTLQSEASRVWIIEAPSMPAADNRPPLKSSAVKGLALALALAGAFVFGLEMLDPTVRLPSEAEKLVDLPTVAVVPKMPTDTA
jgi:uncharacterized protein involved in exopolysaccharide biosynthesis